ncbi:hypothetical protein E1218_13100 [Kribbella turkmenica]|uniref:Uncharacterized protein n=1 Tax=Kribbella turkmenica TaxID=2530375 RepID=A0A4R4X7Y5_9ACTN|nr:hypothetical protein [Kribbella turkmenica]TDD26546.1 hypothetical protein E1218_13100 [Kribbella turkmenica]
MTNELDLRRAWVGMQAAILDADEARAALILHRDDDPDFPAKVALYSVRMLVELATRGDVRDEFREVTTEEMLRLAQADRLI